MTIEEDLAKLRGVYELTLKTQDKRAQHLLMRELEMILKQVKEGLERGEIKRKQAIEVLVYIYNWNQALSQAKKKGSPSESSRPESPKERPPSVGSGRLAGLLREIKMLLRPPPSALPAKPASSKPALGKTTQGLKKRYRAHRKGWLRT